MSPEDGEELSMQVLTAFRTIVLANELDSTKSHAHI